MRYDRIIHDQNNFRLKVQNAEFRRRAERTTDFENTLVPSKLKFHQKILFFLFKALEKWKMKTYFRVTTLGEPDMVVVKVNKTIYIKNRKEDGPVIEITERGDNPFLTARDVV